MKSRMCVTLFLWIGIALPASTQQANSSSSAQPATASQAGSPSQNTAATGKAPLRTTHGDFWDGDEPGVAWLVLHPFASKDYVRRYLQGVQDRVNELDELTASQEKTIKELGASTQQGIQLTSDKATDADYHASDAGNKARTAHESATKANARLTTVESVVSSIDSYKATNQTEVRFRPGQSALSEDAKRALDEIAAPLKNRHGYIIEVQGFSSGRGQAAITASRNMADSVVRYFVVNHEIPAYRIYALGMGNAFVAGEEASGRERTSGGRIEIRVLVNDLDQLASSSISHK
jgi:OOP family OmpA-OmpF porin